MVKKKNAASIAVRQAERSVREIRARSKQLLKNAQLDVKQYRHQLSVLKQQGIVSKRIVASKHQPTRYMLKKLKQFKGVALGHELAVPISKLSMHRAREYTEKGMAERIGKFLTIPRTAVKQKADVYKGHIEVVTQLQRGEERVTKLPTYLEDMHDVLEWLKENEKMINESKGPNGQLGFQLQGRNSRRGFANVRELISYLTKYDGTEPKVRGNIFNGDSKEIRQEFIIIRFRPNKGGPMHPTMEPYYGSKKRSKYAKDRKDQRRGENYRREKERERKARQRLAEDKETYQNRIEKQRKYDRANANARREKRMAKRLLG